MPFFLLLDLIILLLFVWAGIRKGLVLSLCSMLAVFVAFFGAFYLARQFTPMAVEFATPRLEAVLEHRLDETTGISSETVLSSEDWVLTLQNLGVPKHLAQSVQKTLASSLESSQASLTQLIANATVNTIAYPFIFFLSFIILLILWKFVSNALNLVAHLPVLNTLNKTLGGLFGLIKGILILFVLHWALSDLALPPSLDSTWLLQNFSSLFPFSLVRDALLELP